VQTNDPAQSLIGKPNARVLFVDDDAHMLDVMRAVMSDYTGGGWQIHCAMEAAQALAILQDHPIDLVVVDIRMPIVDGIQLLQLVHRKYPMVTKVALTGDSSGAFRQKSLAAGAELFLEKPRDLVGWEVIYATLEALLKHPATEGFRGVMRKVSLPDVVQMECLAHNSSVLEIQSGGHAGSIYFQEGRIIHAQTGSQVGVDAFYSLLASTGGEFAVKPYVEPLVRSIAEPWEFLVMEAARKCDEQAAACEHSGEGSSPNPVPASPDQELTVASLPSAPTPSSSLSDSFHQPAGDQGLAPPSGRPVIVELLVLSNQGEVLYEWQCDEAKQRPQLLQFMAKTAHKLSASLNVGEPERVNMVTSESRFLARFQAGHAVWLGVNCTPSLPNQLSIR
jgi:CheY-like chemotaxis protein